MANMQVTDVTNKMITEVTNLTAGIESSNSKISKSQEFSQVLDTASKKVAANEEITDKDKSVEPKSTVVDKSGSDKVKVSEENKKDPVNNADDRTDAAKEVVNKATEVKDKLKESFDLSEEEISEVMSNMGISLPELLDPNKLKDLMMEISGVTDSITLITDADLYANVKAVMNVQNDALTTIAEDFNIETSNVLEIVEDKDLFANVMADLSSNIDENLDVPVPESMGNVVEEVPAPQLEISFDESAITNVVDNQNLEIVDTTKEPVRNDSTNVNASQIKEVTVQSEATNSNTVKVQSSNVNNEKTAEEVTETTTEVKSEEGSEQLSKMPTTQDQSGKGRNEGFEGANEFGRGSKEHIELTNEVANNTQTVTTTQVNNVGDIVETVTSYRAADANEIVSQVTESIKVNYSAESTSLDMMLHPASLGTVNMQVSQANGVITASIIVESEAVKAALESQLVTLQESFEAAGQKVEAVEVSVANYDLNKGMDQNQNQNREGKEREDAFRVMGSRRRINLNLLDADADEAEEMTEEEAITKDMMERNGNSVDYTV